jgi:hypothetical protein
MHLPVTRLSASWPHLPPAPVPFVMNDFRRSPPLDRPQFITLVIVQAGIPLTMAKALRKF